MNFICKFCQSERKNSNSLRNHERLCNKNPNKQNTLFHDKNFQKTKNGNISNGAIKAKKLGLEFRVSSETRNKISKANSSRSKEVTSRIGRNASKTINEKVANGTWHVSLAKDMHYSYNGVDLHGTWELKFAMYLDDNSIKWERNTESFNYNFDGKDRKYFPDFYLPDSDDYIEIKGFKTPKDDSKWEQFPKNEKLIVLFENDLKDLGIL